MEDHNLNFFQIFAKLLDGKTATLRFTTPQAYGHAIKQRIFEITRIPTESQRLICGREQIIDGSVISCPESTVHLLLRLRGGKGGFGSLLRGAATKAGQKKTNNFDACRDMSGRRLRHVNAEKRLEEWKAEEEERRLEKVAEAFIKKNSKKGKKGVGDSAAQKYVEKYREDSAKCTAEVEAAVREACANGKRKGKMPIDGAEAKRLKIWMGKRKLGGSDSEDSSDDEEEKGNEKSVVLNNGDSVCLNKDTEGSSDSVTGEKQDGVCAGGASCESGSEEEREAACGEAEVGVAEPEIREDLAEVQGGATGCTTDVEVSEVEAVQAEKQENVGNVAESPLVTGEANGEPIAAEINNAGLKKPLNLDEFNSAAELEVLGMDSLKTELQAHGLKCGGTLAERAARLFLLKSTPVEKLPKKLLAKK